jgi:hypothetical protein
MDVEIDANPFSGTAQDWPVALRPCPERAKRRPPERLRLLDTRGELLSFGKFGQRFTPDL